MITRLRPRDMREEPPLPQSALQFANNFKTSQLEEFFSKDIFENENFACKLVVRQVQMIYTIEEYKRVGFQKPHQWRTLWWISSNYQEQRANCL